MPNVNIEPSWKAVLSEYFETAEFANLTNFVKSEYQNKTIFPSPENIFRAFWLTPVDKVKVVILGQDPYHGLAQAHGLSFSVPNGVKVPPSLQNIYKEIELEFAESKFGEFGKTRLKKDFENGNLENWASQGVFLLNSILTVENGKPASHQKIGWENFTDFVIQKLSTEKENLVFMLWGNFAKSKINLINTDKHLVLTAAHPSPFSAHNGFFGCNHFKKCNEFLVEKDLGVINW